MSSKSRTKLLATDTYVSIDTETTGLDTEWCEIIEIAGVKVSHGEVVETFRELVKPRRMPIPSFITELTGITNEMLEGAETIESVIGRFLSFVGDYPIIGQNVTFDLRFIEHALGECGLNPWEPEACDIMRLSRLLLANIPRHRMQDTFPECCRLRGETPDFGAAHRALSDSYMAAFCFETLRPMLVAEYGSDDPDREYNARRNRGRRHENVNLNELVPTVDEIDESNPLFGSLVCFTGALSCMTRKLAWQETVNLGAIPQKSVTKKTDYLVVGSLDFASNMRGDKSSKLIKAEKLLAENGSPQIVSEGFFLQIVRDASGE